MSSPDAVVEGVDDVRQCIDTILKTRKGEDPLRPHFGCGLFDWIDKPNTTAIPNMKKEILQAIKTYETRIIVTSVNHEIVLGGVKFVINYKSPDGRSDSFEFEATASGSISGGTTVPATLVLQAVYDDTANRYFLTLELNGSAVSPTPPASGFASISDLMAWVNNNWYIYGTWYWIFGQKKIVLYVPAAVASTGALSILSDVNVLTALISPLTQVDGYYLISFKDASGQMIQPVNGDTVINKGGILSFVQANYSQYGDWSIDGDLLVLKGSVDLTGCTLSVSEQVAVLPAFTTGFNLGFQA